MTMRKHTKYWKWLPLGSGKPVDCFSFTALISYNSVSGEVTIAPGTSQEKSVAVSEQVLFPCPCHTTLLFLLVGHLFLRCLSGIRPSLFWDTGIFILWITSFPWELYPGNGRGHLFCFWNLQRALPVSFSCHSHRAWRSIHRSHQPLHPAPHCVPSGSTLHVIHPDVAPQRPAAFEFHDS